METLVKFKKGAMEDEVMLNGGEEAEAGREESSSNKEETSSADGVILYDEKDGGSDG